MDNEELRQKVIEELEFEPSIDASSIGVAVENGVVTLSGHLHSYAAKLAAENAARRVRGVRAIAQEIEVRYPSDKKTADDEIAKRAVAILKWDAMSLPGAVGITVEKGWVTLSGEVGWQYQRTAAEQVVRRLSGVTGVNNNITLKSPVYVTDIKQKIESALSRHAMVEAQAIRVTVHDGNKVSLEGEVESWDERNAIENAAWSVPGVQSVEDRLTVLR